MGDKRWQKERVQRRGNGENSFGYRENEKEGNRKDRIIERLNVMEQV